MIPSIKDRLSPRRGKRMCWPTSYTRFKYPLLKNQHGIRLLSLHAGSWNESIECTLFEIDLSHRDEHSWTAISYAWGDPQPCHKIRLHGRILVIPDSCFGALRSVRSAERDAIVWIDAVCIDQNNDTEKGHPVQRMAQIYRHAESVIVWLGEPSETMRNALGSFAQISEALDHGRLTVNSTIEEVLAVTGTALKSSNWTAAGEMFSKAWFERLWVVQEVLLARSVSFRLGDHGFSWDAVELVSAVMLKRFHDVIALQIDTIFNYFRFRSLTDLRRDLEYKREQGMSLSLAHVLFECSYQGASNPKDYVYGVLGLVQGQTDETTPSLIVNYSQDDISAFIDATVWCIQREKNLDVLCLVESSRDRGRVQLPSWVPDYAFVTNQAFGLRQNHSACGPHLTTTCSLEQMGPVLVLDGIIADKISLHGSEADAVHNEIPLKEGNMLPVEWCKEALSIQRGDTEGRELEFWRTLIGDIKNEFPEEGKRRQFVDDELMLISILLEKALLDEPRCANMDVSELRKFILYDLQFSPTERDLLIRFVIVIMNVCHERRFVITRDGHMGLVGGAAQKDDLICILRGGSVPFVIRPLPEHGKDCYTLIGEAYIRGLMNGEGIEKGSWQMIKLV